MVALVLVQESIQGSKDPFHELLAQGRHVDVDEDLFLLYLIIYLV